MPGSHTSAARFVLDLEARFAGRSFQLAYWAIQTDAVALTTASTIPFRNFVASLGADRLAGGSCSSPRKGRIFSSALLWRLRNESRENRTYKASRELRRAIGTIVLLRYLSEPELRESITAIVDRLGVGSPTLGRASGCELLV